MQWLEQRARRALEVAIVRARRVADLPADANRATFDAHYTAHFRSVGRALLRYSDLAGQRAIHGRDTSDFLPELQRFCAAMERAEDRCARELGLLPHGPLGQVH